MMDERATGRLYRQRDTSSQARREISKSLVTRYRSRESQRELLLMTLPQTPDIPFVSLVLLIFAKTSVQGTLTTP
jgi:hypothetical protein